jgi:hypothetical protein
VRVVGWINLLEVIGNKMLFGLQEKEIVCTGDYIICFK